ncbi:hypothetical protein [Algirhabdus cladophorae]|uniref:hypothetical protein n=1 Tax=Algirhabdus cladophorae TaxID=3377108 RepID=UPI003B8475C0
MRILSFIIFAICWFPSVASAFWNIQISDEDVFGNVNVEITSFGGKARPYFMVCGSNGPPFFAFLIKGQVAASDYEPAKFLFLRADGSLIEADAELGPWNDTYSAVRVFTPHSLRIFASELISATNPIQVGVQAGTLRLADSVSSNGSTEAGRAFLKHCLE